MSRRCLFQAVEHTHSINLAHFLPQVGSIFRRLLAPRDPALRSYPCPLHPHRSASPGLADGLIQVVEEDVERAFGDALPDGIINNGDRAFEIRVRVIAQQRAIGLVSEINLGERPGCLRCYCSDFHCSTQEFDLFPPKTPK